MSRRRHRRAHREPAVQARAIAKHSARITGIDALRGLAICLMIVYHFSFDLSWFKVIAADFNRDWFWLGFRGVIVASFLALVGISLVLAQRAGTSTHRFLRRIALIGVTALLATVGSYMVFPKSFIFFGILHCIAIASIIARPLVSYPIVALTLGIAIVVLGNTLRLPLFDTPALNWVGLMTHKPVTEDYVPLFPWLGVVLLGIPAGAWLAARDFRPLRPLGRAAPRWLDWLGRHSLAVYIVHQPVLIGLVWVVVGR